MPELRWAWPRFRHALVRLASRYAVIGHGHPRAMKDLAPWYERVGIEVVPDFANVCHGERTIADALARPRFGAWVVSHGGVRNVLCRVGLGRRSARLAAAESLAASKGGPLTERVLREVRAIEWAKTVHIGSDVPGEESFLDTFNVGQLKGVGKVWQFSAVDGASSFGMARVIAGPKSTAAMARFLTGDVLPTCARAGLRLVTATTDNGPEFGAVFSAACRDASVRHHRIPLRSPQPQCARRALQGHGPASPLPGRLPLALLHQCRRHRCRPAGLPTVWRTRCLGRHRASSRR